ncbi:MAG: hypothetical protein ACRCX8_06805 [Sarcina sp.]
MKTKIEGFKKDYQKILKDIKKFEDALVMIGLGCNELPYNGYGIQVMKDEYKIRDEIHKKVLELKSLVERVV